MGSGGRHQVKGVNECSAARVTENLVAFDPAL